MSPTRKTPIDYNASSAAKRRADHAMEAAEDYVELIEEMQAKVGAAHITDIARHLGVSHVTVHKTIKRLKMLGLVQAEPYRAITLTAQGRSLAQESRRRHEITLRFLRALGMSEGEALNDAEGIEHHVGAELLEKMRLFSSAMEARGIVRREDLKITGHAGEKEES
jgi:DtxR family manganese transport transcriptional regulator